MFWVGRSEIGAVDDHCGLLIKGSVEELLDDYRDAKVSEKYKGGIVKMKLYDMRELTLADVKELIKSGDDNHNNQIRVTKSGQLYLSQDVVGAENIEGLLFRFETFDAHNDYVGLNASMDERFISRIYKALKDNWKNPKSTYVDDWNYEE